MSCTPLPAKGPTKLFNPYHYEKKGRKRIDEKNVILEEDYPASIYEALRHNKVFHQLVQNGRDPHGRDLDPIVEGFRFDMSRRTDVSLDTPWNEISVEAKSRYRKTCCSGFIQTEMTTAYLDHLGCHTYEGKIAEVLVAMLDDGRIEQVKSFLLGSGNRLVTLPKSTKYHGKDVKKVFRKQFDAFVKPYIMGGNSKVYPEEEDWRLFLNLKRFQISGNNLFQAFSMLMIQEDSKGWSDELKSEYILDNKQVIDDSVILKPTSQKGIKLMKYISRTLEDSQNPNKRSIHPVAMRVGRVVKFSQELVPFAKKGIIEYLEF